MSTKRSYILKKISAASFFKYVWPFSGHQTLKGWPFDYDYMKIIRLMVVKWIENLAIKCLIAKFKIHLINVFSEFSKSQILKSERG